MTPAPRRRLGRDGLLLAAMLCVPLLVLLGFRVVAAPSDPPPVEERPLQLTSESTSSPTSSTSSTASPTPSSSSTTRTPSPSSTRPTWTPTPEVTRTQAPAPSYDDDDADDLDDADDGDDADDDDD